MSTPGRVTPTCCLIRGRRGVSQREVTSTEVFRAPRPPVARGAPRCPCVPGPRMCGVRAPNAHGGFLVRSRYADSPLNNVTCTINTITETHSAPGGKKDHMCSHAVSSQCILFPYLRQFECLCVKSALVPDAAKLSGFKPTDMRTHRRSVGQV